MPVNAFARLVALGASAASMVVAASGASATASAEAMPATEPATIEYQGKLAYELSEAEVLALNTEKNRRLTVPVTIKGQGPFRFLVDTGAQATVLSNSLADTLGLEDRTQVHLVAMTSAKTVEAAQITEIALGSRAFSVPKGPLIDAKNIGDADGILGVDSLQNQRVLLDFEKRELAVAEARELGGDRGFDIIVRAQRELNQLIIHRARVNGKRVSVIIDTGAEASIGNLALLRELRASNVPTNAKMTDIHGVETYNPVRQVHSLTIERARIENFPVLFTDGPTFDALNLADEPALVLGMSELRLFRRVAIDFDKRRILFDLPDDTDIAQAGLFSRGGRFGRTLPFDQ